MLKYLFICLLVVSQVLVSSYCISSVFQSFLDYFARALNYEYKNKGITIQSLMPFYVNTKMTRYSQTLTSHSFLVPSASEYARHAVATLGYSGRTTGYWPHTFQVISFINCDIKVKCYSHTRVHTGLKST